MSTRKASSTRTPRLAAAFDRKLSTHLQALRREVDRPSKAPRSSRHLAALEQTVARLASLLTDVAGRRAGDLTERVEELEYPFAKLGAYFAGKKTGLDQRAIEIMAEYVRDRMLEIKIVAKSLDAKR